MWFSYTPLQAGTSGGNTFPQPGGGGGWQNLSGEEKNGGPKNPSSKTTASAIEEMLFKARFVASRVLKKKCFGGLFQFCSRALGPPRLAAGAGDRQSETLTNIYNLAPSGCFSKRFPWLTPAFSNPQAPACPFIRKDLFRLRACLRPLAGFRKRFTTNPLLPDSGWAGWW